MLSVIVPAYNEEEVLPIFHGRLVAALANSESSNSAVADSPFINAPPSGRPSADAA